MTFKFVQTSKYGSYNAVAERLRNHLSNLRAKKAREHAIAEFDVSKLTSFQDMEDLVKSASQGPKISDYDNSRIRERVTKIMKISAAEMRAADLSDSQKAKITYAIENSCLAQSFLKQNADEMAAELESKFPWMNAANDFLWHELRRAEREGGAVTFHPVILNGPSGIGKSTWGRHVAQMLSVPTHSVDCGKTSVGWEVFGMERGWAKAGPGYVLKLMMASTICNPVIVVDEICKSGHASSTSGHSFNFANGLLAMLEQETARQWTCPFYRIKFDMTRISWILTSNRLCSIPSPLRSRCQVIDLPKLTEAQLIGVARLQGADQGLCEDSIEAIAETIPKASKMSRRELSLRDVNRMLMRARNLENQPMLQ